MDLFRLSARRVRDLLRSGDVSPDDVIDAAEARIAAVDGAVHALPTLCADRARREAARRGAALRGTPLAGLPVVIKDLVDVAGVRSTRGSLVFADRIPERSAPIVTAIEAAGGLVMARSNTPEFGAGASTFNALFPTTRNPHDLSLSVAGSSGGSAAALAAGMAWLAHGSDFAGSLRTPASFCGVVGLRPSPGLAPGGAVRDRFDTLFLEGPMARTVADAALFLDAMSGWASPQIGPFERAAAAPAAPKRVAFSADLGVTPVDPTVRAVVAAAAGRFSELGADVVEGRPDCSGAAACFQTLRALGFAAELAPLLETDRDRIKPDVVWNIEKGLAQSGAEVAAAVRARAALCARFDAFFDQGGVDVLALPSAIVPPFAAETRTVERVGDHRFETYVDWLAIVFVVSLTGRPALSLPCGRTPEGAPIGLQLVGRRGGEADLLRAAAALEAHLGWDPSPIDPGGPDDAS